MQKLLLLLFLSLGFIGNSYATVMICTDNNDHSTCTAPSSPSDMADIWYCKEGYIKSSDETRCIKIGEDENVGQPSTKWYENGQKNIESHFKYGIEHGIKTQWYENGQKDIESHFKDGIEHGIRTQWNESGKIELEATFKDGECISGDC